MFRVIPSKKRKKKWNNFSHKQCMACMQRSNADFISSLFIFIPYLFIIDCIIFFSFPGEPTKNPFYRGLQVQYFTYRTTSISCGIITAADQNRGRFYGKPHHLLNNYSRKHRWLMSDIYIGARRWGKYPLLTTNTEM